MYGYKVRIGLMIPSPNVTIEPEFNAIKPEGVSIHVARLLLEDITGTVENLSKMAEDTEMAAKLLCSAGVHIIAYGCTTGSLIKGLGWDQELINRIERTANIPATTTSSAVIQVFRKLGVDKVAIATPYSDELNQKEKEFIEAHGIKVVNIKGIDIHGEDRWRALPEVTYKLACEVNTTEAEAVFISCTDFKSITVIEELEKNLKKYVFSSNTATMWDVLKRLGVSEQIRGYGRLFRLIE